MRKSIAIICWGQRALNWRILENHKMVDRLIKEKSLLDGYSRRGLA